jgi:hypothetical protein
MFVYAPEGVVEMVRESFDGGVPDGWVEVALSPRPSVDHVSEFELVAGGWSQVWRLDVAARAERLAQVARSQRRERLAGAVAELRAVEGGRAPNLRVLAGVLADLIEERGL